MIRRQNLERSASIAIRAGVLLLVLGLTAIAQDRNPVIIIPGLSGSELRHKDTGERIWFRALRSKAEDIRLPISDDIATNHDLLVPGDVLRAVRIGGLKVADVYGGLVEALEGRAGYREDSWTTPAKRGSAAALYVFPYDWRLDNVTNARRLFRQVEDLKRKLNKPDLKFDIVSHSMGGLISRYAAMYGDADLPTGVTSPVPTWAGAEHFNKIILIGTPNEGSAMALNTLLNGFMLGGVRIDLPFVHDSSKFTVFTIPSVYQLLPAPGTLRAFDDKLNPVEIDIYDPTVWNNFGWNVIRDEGFANEFSKSEQARAERYFESALERAKRLHNALAAPTVKPSDVSFHVMGSECRSSLDSILIYRDGSANTWKTLFKPRAFTRSDGVRVTDSQLKKVMMTPGDGVVTRRSLESATKAPMPGKLSAAAMETTIFVCEEHTRLPKNSLMQDHVMAVLGAKPNMASPYAASGR